MYVYIYFFETREKTFVEKKFSPDNYAPPLDTLIVHSVTCSNGSTPYIIYKLKTNQRTTVRSN